jgi:hypothetical protein
MRSVPVLLASLALTCAGMTAPVTAHADPVDGLSSGSIAYVAIDLAAQTQGINALDLSTGAVTVLEPAVQDTSFTGLAVSPDGTRLAFTTGVLRVRDLATGTTSTVTSAATGPASWAGNSHLVATDYGTSTVVSLDADGSTDPVTLVGSENLYSAATSPDASLVVGRTGSYPQAYQLLDTTTGRRRTVSAGIRRLDGGRTIAPSATAEDPNGYAALAADSFGHHGVDLGVPLSRGAYPIGDVTTDGATAVVSVRDESDGYDLYVARGDGSGARALTNTPAINELEPVWLGPGPAAVTPAAPSLGMVTTAVAPRSATLSWPEPASSATLGARLLWKRGTTPPLAAADANATEEALGSELSRTTVLAPGEWSYRIAAFDGFGQESPARTGSVTVPIDPPAAPTGVIAYIADGLSDSVKVGWSPAKATAAGPVTSYTITRSPGGATAVQTVSGQTFRALYKTLAPGVKYTFTVRTTNADGTSAASAASKAVATRPHVFVVSSGRTTISEGGSYVITGRLQRVANHLPVAGQKLYYIYTPDSGMSLAQIRGATTLTTDKNGYVRLRVHPNTPTSYQFRFSTTPLYVYHPLSPGWSSVQVRFGMTASLPREGEYVPKGTRLRLSGSTSRAESGRSAVVEWYHGGHWYSLGSTRISSGGTFSYLLPPAPYGAYYRVHLPAVSGRPYSSSKPMLMRVNS